MKLTKIVTNSTDEGEVSVLSLKDGDRVRVEENSGRTWEDTVAGAKVGKRTVGGIRFHHLLSFANLYLIEDPAVTSSTASTIWTAPVPMPSWDPSTVPYPTPKTYTTTGTNHGPVVSREYIEGVKDALEYIALDKEDQAYNLQAIVGLKALKTLGIKIPGEEEE